MSSKLQGKMKRPYERTCLGARPVSHCPELDMCSKLSLLTRVIYVKPTVATSRCRTCRTCRTMETDVKRRASPLLRSDFSTSKLSRLSFQILSGLCHVCRHPGHIAVMRVLDKIIQADSPTTSASIKDDKEKQSSISDSPALSDEGSDLQLREDAGDYPPPVTRWAIVIALLLGEFLVSSHNPNHSLLKICVVC